MKKKMKKKIILDENLCIGCGTCIAQYETNFRMNDHGLAEVTKNNIIDIDDIYRIIALCPVSAIKIEEK